MIAGMFLLRKASQWEPAEEILMSKVDRDLLKDLVIDLTDTCVQLKVDPENLDKLNESLGATDLATDFYKVIHQFFQERLNMEE